MTEINAEELKQEIDTSKNEKIELQEMEDFLKTDENIKKLGNALETNVPQKIIEEYMNAIGELCDKIIDTKEKEKKITLNQFKILSLYFKHYNTENGNKKTYEKVKKIVKNLYKNYYKEQDMYLKGKGEKPTGPVAEYFENLQQEKINELNESIRNYIEQMQMENDPLYKKAKEDSERMDKLLEKWENDKQEIEEILQKSGIKTEEEIKKLTYFRDYYYKEGHIIYKRDEIEEEVYNQLSNELGGRSIHGIIGYDEIANRIDEVEQLYILSKEIDSELLAPEGELNNTLSNLESLGIKRKTNLNWENIKNDIKTTDNINTIITKESIKKYIEIPQNTPEENYEYIAENIRILLYQHFSLNPGRKSLILGGDATGMNLENLYKNINYELKLHKELENLGNLDNQIETLTKRPIKNSDLLEIRLKTTINKDNWKNILTKLYNNIPLNQSINFFGKYNSRHKDSCINIQDYRLFRIQELGKKDIDSQINTILTLLPTNHEFLELWLKTTLNSKKYNQETVLTRLFDKISSSTFFQICNKNKFINELKNNYVLYWLNKNDSISTDNKTYCFLDWQNKSNFDSFYGKGIKISEELTFDELYERTKNFYEGLKTYNISPKIPIPNILEFYDKVKKLQPRLEQIKKQYGKSMGEVSEMRNNPIMNIGSPTIGGGFGSGANLSEQSTKKIFDRDKAKIMTDLAEAYAKLLLKDPTMRGKKITAPKEFGGFTLDFSKTTPEAVVIDSFKENIEEQRKLFLYNLKNDRQAAFGSFMGMVGGIAGSSLVAISTGNIWATSVGFTAGLRLGNGLGQELWNSGEFLYEQISGNKINDGNNKVEFFGQGFLRGVGALDQNYEFVGTAEFLSGLGFDYLSTVATFGLSNKFGGFLGKLEGVKFTGGALKFGMEELILENFLVDIPMNIVQTGLEAVTGIDNGGVTVGNTSMGNERTVKGEKPYEKGSLSDMLRAMKDAATENLSIENLSQTFFNTMIYGGFLEGGGAAIKKMKNHLPAGQVDNFTERSKAAANAFAGLTNFMNEKNITFNKDGICIDTKTNSKIEESDPRFKELATHIKAVEATKAGVIESFETIMETQRQMISDPENKTGLLFRLGLISTTNTPLNILKKKKELAEKKLQEAKKKGEKDKERQLQKLLDIYADAEQRLSEVTTDKDKYQKVDIQEYLSEGLKEGRLEIIEAEKSAKIQAIRGEIGQEVITWSVDEKGNPIKEKVAKVEVDPETGKAGRIVTKVDENGNPIVDKNGKLNQWIIGDTTFNKKYEIENTETGIYKAVGGIQKFVKIKDNIILEQWGSEFKIAKGGYINITNPNDMYGISVRDFEDTYRVVEPGKSEKQNSELTESEKSRDKDIDEESDNLTSLDFQERKEFFENMSPDEIMEYAKKHLQEIIEIYDQDPESKNVCDIDNFRKFVGGDVGIPAYKTHAAATFLADSYFDYILEKNQGTGNNTIKFLAGGAGSGKSSISAFPESNHSLFSGVFDGTMSSYKYAEINIQKAIEKGYNIRIEFVYRDITEAFVNGVLTRTIAQNKKYKQEGKGDYLGRTVPLHIFENGHNGARETILQLYEKYGPNIVKFFGGGETELPLGNGVLNKAKGKSIPGKGSNFVYEFDVDYIKNAMNNDKLDIERCKLAIEEAYMRKEISESQRNDLLGNYK